MTVVVEEKEISSSLGLSAIGRSYSGTTLTIEQIEQRRQKMERLVGRHQMSDLMRGIEETRKENVFCSCMAILFAALKFAPIYKVIQMFNQYLMTYCNHDKKFSERYFQKPSNSIMLTISELLHAANVAGFDSKVFSDFLVTRHRKAFLAYSQGDYSRKVRIKLADIYKMIAEAMKEESDRYFQESAQYLIRNSGYRLEYLQTMTSRIKLPIFDLYMRRMREILGNDLTAERWVGKQANRVNYGNTLKLSEAVSSPFLLIIMAHAFIPGINATCNITKDFIMRVLKATEALFDMIIFPNVDPVWEDGSSRFFIMGMLEAIPSVWSLADEKVYENTLQYSLADTMLYYKLESIRLGIKEAFDCHTIQACTIQLIIEQVKTKALNEIMAEEYLLDLDQCRYNEEAVDLVIEEAKNNPKLLKLISIYQLQEIPLLSIKGTDVFLNYDSGQKELLGIAIGKLLNSDSGEVKNQFIFDNYHSFRERGIALESIAEFAPDAIYITNPYGFTIKARSGNPFGIDLPLIRFGQVYNYNCTRYHSQWENPTLIHRLSMLGENFLKGWSVFKRMLELYTIEKMLKEYEKPLRQIREENLQDIERKIELFRDVDFNHPDFIKQFKDFIRNFFGDDEVTINHTYNVFDNTRVLAERLLQSSPIFTNEVASRVTITSALHDVGKALVDPHILHKKGKLDRREIEEIRNHAAYGEKIVLQFGFSIDHAKDVRGHHEKPSGKGYPDGLHDKEISLGALIIAVQDIFEAISSRIFSVSSSREYLQDKKQLTISEIIDIMVKDSQENNLSPYFTRKFIEMILGNGFISGGNVIHFPECKQKFLEAIAALKELDDSD